MRLVEAQVPRRVARRPDGGEVPAGHFRLVRRLRAARRARRRRPAAHRHGGVAQGLELLLRRAHPAQGGGHAVEQVVRLVVAVVDELGIGGVERDPRARGLPDPPGQPVVIGMDVGDQDALDIGHVAADLLHAAVQRAEGVVGVPSGIDQVGAAVGLEDVDEDVAQRVVGQRYRNAPEAVAHLLDTRERVVGCRRAPGALGVRGPLVLVCVPRRRGHDWPRGSLGRPSPRSAMRLRMISFDPPAMVQARA